MGTEARYKNSRIKQMIERCTELKSNVVSSPKYRPPLHTQQHFTILNKENQCNSHHQACKNIIAKNTTEEELVNSLYAAKYSMTSSIFRKLDETKTSYNLGQDFTELIATINADLPRISKEVPLMCNEDMPPNSLSSLSGDFSSDDSVKDKDYCPSNESSADDYDSQTSAKKIKPSTCHNKTIRRNYTSNLEPHLENNNSKQLEAIATSAQPEAGPSSSAIITAVQPEADASLSAIDTVLQESSMEAPLSAHITLETSTETRISVRERKLKQKQEKLLRYNVKIGCNEKCIKKCSIKFTPDAREAINKKYLALSWKERRIFIQNIIAVAIPKRKVTSEPKRAPRSTFTLKNQDGTNIDVCKTFFLTTLGFHKNNDIVLYNSLKKIPFDRRGLHTKTAPLDRTLLTNHVESFHPLEPHYRREHAPLRRYIACDITVTLMHKDFCEKYPSQKVSYELYRKHVKSMNISFAKLGNEECEVCEAYELHAKNTSHDSNNVVPENCETCALYVCHRKKYKKARDLYESHKKNEQSLENIYYSVDLQKVIMLPRLDSFKSIIFCPRLTAFNLTFAPVGKITSQHKPLACIWHDGISGRKQEDIMSCYYHFILQHRDVKNIVIWMDNCSAQNKNWLLFSLMVYLINSDLIATETITFQYFEPGHTCMSCDQFHHQVELAMKKKGKLYDFQDFTECVASANLARVDVKSMQAKDFFNFQNYVSDRRIQSSTPRVYLKEIIQVRFERNNYDILYKTEVDVEDYEILRFMTDKYLKNTDVLKPQFKNIPKGIEKARKDAVIRVLKDISAPHKMQFWHDIPENTGNVGMINVNNRSTL